MSRIVRGLGLGALVALVWGLTDGVLTLAGGAPATGVPASLALLVVMGFLGGAASGLAGGGRLRTLDRGDAIAVTGLLGVAFVVTFGVHRFLLSHSFDLLDEIALFFAAAVVATLAGVRVLLEPLRRRLTGPAGGWGAAPAAALAVMGAAVASAVTSRIVGFELVTVAAGSVACFVGALALEAGLPARWRAPQGPGRTLATLGALVGVLALGGGLMAYQSSDAVRRAAWSHHPLAKSFASTFARLTDADYDGVSASLGHPDCDDVRATIFPGAREEPGNGRDDNCYGGDVSKEAVAALWTAPAGARARVVRDLAFERKRYNIVVITIDAVRADHLSLYGYERPTSPNLDNLAKLSIVFDNAWSASNYTASSLFALFTGLYPTAFLEGDQVVKREGMTLSEHLYLAGYRTELIVDFHPPLHHVYAGYTRVDDSLGTRAAAAVRNRSSGSTARDITRLGYSALQRMDQSEEPTFLWMHYSEPHAAYLPHETYVFGDGGSELDLYDGEIAFADAAVGRFLRELAEDGRLEDTIIVVASDHGEAFGEHGVGTHGQSLYEEELHVPLLVYLPSPDGKGFATKRVPSPVDLTDVTPTILDAIGLPPRLPMHGESLLPHVLNSEPLRTPEAFAEIRLPYARLQALRVGDTKIVADHLVGSVVAFDLAADPGERSGRWGDAEALETLARWTDLHLAFPDVKTVPLAEVNAPPPRTRDGVAPRTRPSAPTEPAPTAPVPAPPDPEPAPSTPEAEAPSPTPPRGVPASPNPAGAEREPPPTGEPATP